jgi:ABC-type transporter Mla subunit MlaD
VTAIRRRIRHRASAAQMSLQLRRSVRPTVVYAAGLALGIGCVVYIAGSLPGGGGLSSTRTYQVAVYDATGVVGGRDEVRFEGIPAGTIDSVQREHGVAVLSISLQSQYGQLYRNAQAQLRPNTPLDDMYLDIISRGTPGSGMASANQPLAPSQTASSVNISDVLNVFRGDVRANLAATLSQFGQGLGNRGAQVQAAFVKLVPFLQVAGRISQQVAIRSEETKTLIHNASLLTAELGRRQQALRTLITAGGRTLDTFASRTPALGSILSELPPTLSILNSSFASVRSVLPPVNTAVRSLYAVANELPSGLAAVRSLSAAAHPALSALVPVVTRLDPTANALRQLSGPLDTAVSTFLPQAGNVDRVTANVAGCGFTIQRFFQWTQSVFSFGDVHGEGPRGDASIALDTPGLVPDPNVVMSPTCSHATITGGTPIPQTQP